MKTVPNSTSRPSAPRYRAFEALRSYEDGRTGIRERFLTPRIGGSQTIAVVSEPLGEASPIGWVLCHSFGQDQVYMQPFEVPAARALAAAGFPVLRFHVQGYGDSEAPRDHISLASHVEQTVEASELLLHETGASHLGFLGTRFGGSVACLSADRLGADMLAVWEPVVTGRAYMKGLLRLGMLTKLASDDRRAATAKDPQDVLLETGVLDVQGFPLRSEVFHEVSELDLAGQLTSFRGRSIVVQISRSNTPRPGLERLVGHLRSLGGASTLAIVTDAKADKFGQPRFVGLADGTKTDTQATLAERLVDTTLAWCRDSSTQLEESAS